MFWIILFYNKSIILYYTIYITRYATLPRRRRKSKENISVAPAAVQAVSPPCSKEPSLNRAASLRRKHIEQGALAQNAAAAAASPSLPAKPCTLPRASRPQQHSPVVVKTKIYHEICSQTCLTGEDITKVLEGKILPLVENRVETSDAEIQVGRSCFVYFQA